MSNNTQISDLLIQLSVTIWLFECSIEKIKYVITDPIKREPKSPRKTFFSDLKLNIKKPIKAPIKVNE